MSWLEAWHSVRLVVLAFAVGLGAFILIARVYPFEWLLARRYLKLPKDRSPHAHLITLSFAMVWLLTQVLSTWMDHSHSLKVQELRESFGGIVDKVRLGAIVLTVLVEVFVRINRRLTVFSTISTFGVFLGTAALVLALSVMSGF